MKTPYFAANHDQPSGLLHNPPRQVMDTADEFLLGGVRFCLDPQQFPVPAWPPGLATRPFLESIGRNRVQGLFFQAGKLQPGWLPEDVQNELQQAYYRGLVNGVRYEQQIQAILQGLQQAGIPVIVLKAWACIPTVYGGDCSLRPYGDIDLLVRPAEVRTAEAVLLACGLGIPVELWPGNRFRYHNCAFHYTKKLETGEDFNLDLHWGLFNRRYHDEWVRVEDLFERARPLALAGQAAAQLSVEDTLLHTCGHISLHHEYGPELNRYYELAWLARQAAPEVDWSGLLERARAWKLTPAVQRVLLKTEALFPHTLPEAELARLRELPVDGMETATHNWLVHNTGSPLSCALPARWTPASLLESVLILVEDFFPGPAFLNWRYGKRRFWPWHYLRRMVNAVRQARELYHK